MSSPPNLLMIMQSAPAPNSMGALFSSFVVPMILVFGIFWIIVLRPQNRRVKEHQATIMAVKKGDDVITAGGIRGRVTKVTDEDAEVEIASGVRVRVVKSTLTAVLSGNSKPAND
jgi:preprotein translocase subunit YajC